MRRICGEVLNGGQNNKIQEERGTSPRRASPEWDKEQSIHQASNGTWLCADSKSSPPNMGKLSYLTWQEVS